MCWTKPSRRSVTEYMQMSRKRGLLCVWLHITSIYSACLYITHTHTKPYTINNTDTIYHTQPTPDTHTNSTPPTHTHLYLQKRIMYRKASRCLGHCTVSNVTFYRLLYYLFCFHFLFSSTLWISLCSSLPRISYSPGYLWTDYLLKDDFELLILLTPPLHPPNAEVMCTCSHT